MIEMSSVPPNIPVSWMHKLFKLGDDDLFLVTQVSSDGQMASKFIEYYSLANDLSIKLDVKKPKREIERLVKDYIQAEDINTEWVFANQSDYYVTDAIRQGVDIDINENAHVGILEQTDYRLSVGMRNVFENGDVGDVITYLKSDNTMNVANPTSNYISGIVTENGRVAELKTGSFREAFQKSLVSNDCNVAPGNYISSVQFVDGCLCSIGQNSIANVVGSVRMCDGTSKTNTYYPVLNDFQLNNLSVIKLTDSQLDSLKQESKIIPGCIYLTVADSDIA